MKTCYFDCFAGISGDMLLGAFVDAGLSPTVLEAELRKLRLEGWSLTAQKVRRGELTATKLTFQISETHHHRTWRTIREMLHSSELPDAVRQRAEAIFLRLAEVEAAVHDVAIDEVHFHEVGALDSILDIVGASVAVERLGLEKILVSPLNVGTGTVKTAHGVLPVPAPATAGLLKGAPVYSSGLEGELVTPTGAAVVSVLASSYGSIPLMRVSVIGYGAGDRNPDGYPNVLRVFVGESVEAGVGPEKTDVMVLEANIDDMNPVIGGYLIEQALAAGALDVFYTPVQMKKNRPGITVTVLSPPDRLEALCELLFAQTTSLGVRYYPVQRRVLERQFVEVTTPFGPVRMKVGWLDGRVVNAAPEYDDCQRLAREKGVPLKQVMAEAQFQYRRQQEESG